MAGKLTFSMIDYSGEPTSVGLWTPVLDNGNIDDYALDIPLNPHGLMKDAIAALTGCNYTKRSVLANTIIEPNPVPPVDDTAQREIKALVNYVDTVLGTKLKIEIPGYNRVGLNANSDSIDLTQADWATFVTQFEANFVSKYGNPVVVVSAKMVGRNS
jgi:hypothetical protein